MVAFVPKSGNDPPFLATWPMDYISLLQNSDAVLLQVFPLRVFGKRGKSVTTYALLDSGSEKTLVDPSLMSSLDLKGQPDELVVSTVSKDNDIAEKCWCGRALKIQYGPEIT